MVKLSLKGIKMDYEFVKSEWNKNADEFNQWDDLGEDEKIEFTIQLTATKAAAIINDPIKSNHIVKTLLSIN